MDKILQGIVASEHPEGVKRAIISKVLASASNKTPCDQVEAVLHLSAEWICEEESQFIQEVGQVTFEAWACHHKNALQNYLCRSFLATVFATEVRNPARVLRFVKECLRIVSDTEEACQLLQRQCVSLSRDYPDLGTMAELGSLLLDYPSCIPDGSYAVGLLQYFIKNLSKLKPPVSENDQRKCLADVAPVSKAVSAIWQKNFQAILPSLVCLFEVISQVPQDESALPPSPALGCLVQFIPGEVIDMVIKRATTDTSISDEQLRTALTRIVDWLSWPGVRNVDQWAITFFVNLAVVKKFSILIHVTIAMVESVFLKLSFPVVRNSAFKVFQHMMLSFQHSPEAFHKITSLVPDIISKLKTEDSVSSRECCEKLADLLYTLMYHFPGYPEIYIPVIESIKSFPIPAEETMKSSLLQVTWTASKNLFGLSSKFAPRSETGKAGLVNLGNTCYMNSVIQALFVIKGFREDVLNFPHLLSKQSIMFQLQTTFAFLAYTQRAAYSPDRFLQVSRPPWFSAGAQQDCSEFLKYLLDRLDEEESSLLKLLSSPTSGESSKNSSTSGRGDMVSKDGNLSSPHSMPSTRTLVQKYFGGKSATSTRCLKCNYISRREETFVDIPLAFPETDASSRTKGLGGGDAKKRPCPDVAVCEAEELHEAPKAVDMEQAHGSGHSLMVDEGLTPDEAYACQIATSSSQGGSGQKDLEGLLRHYFNPELMNGDNQYRCDSCNHLQDAEKITHVVEAPEILVLTLMRFSYDPVLQKRCKIQDHVILPNNLHLPRRNIKDEMKLQDYPSEDEEVEMTLPEVKKLKSVEADKTSVEYSLVGAVVHSGLSSESGHYYCYGRTDHNDDSLVLLEDRREEQWCLFNDDRVSTSSFESLRDISSRFRNDTAYVLFYQKARSSGTRNFSSTAVRTRFQDMVAKDNSDYLEEQEREARHEKASRRSLSSSNPWYKDPDDSNEPPGGCGLGGGGGVPPGHLVF